MKVPAHVIKNSKCKDGREWKSKKRKQARAARKAIDALRSGCAYFPNDSTDVEIAAKAIDRIIEDISVENYGR
jgi:hypothetical protein